MSGAHFGRCFARQRDVDQLATFNAGAVFGGFLPLNLVVDQAWPVGEGFALERLYCVDAAATFYQKRAPFPARDAEPAKAFRAIHVSLFEGGGRHIQMAGDTD